MQAIILAAGYATRLYPLTEHMPKALLPIGGRPMIDYIVDEMQGIGRIERIIVVSNHRFAAPFQAWADGRESAKPIVVLDDGSTDADNRLGAIGDMRFAVEQCAINDELLVVAGDNLFTFPLARFIAAYDAFGTDCVAAQTIDDTALLRQFAVAGLDANGRVTSLVEKPETPPSNVAVFAVYAYRKETVPLIARYLAEGNNPDAPGHFAAWLCAEKPVHAYIMEGECYDVGTVEAYEMVNTKFRTKNAT